MFFISISLHYEVLIYSIYNDCLQLLVDLCNQHPIMKHLCYLGCFSLLLLHIAVWETFFYFLFAIVPPSCSSQKSRSYPWFFFPLIYFLRSIFNSQVSISFISMSPPISKPSSLTGLLQQPPNWFYCLHSCPSLVSPPPLCYTSGSNNYLLYLTLSHIKLVISLSSSILSILRWNIYFLSEIISFCQ